MDNIPHSWVRKPQGSAESTNFSEILDLSLHPSQQHYNVLGQSMTNTRQTN